MNSQQYSTLAIAALRSALSGAGVQGSSAEKVLGGFAIQWNGALDAAAEAGNESQAHGNDEAGPSIPGWVIKGSEDGKYVYVSRDGSPGEIHIKAEDEGFVADIWSNDEPPVCVAGTSATYVELERE